MNTCLLDGYDIVRYDAAFPLDSTAEISFRLEYLGVGVIYEIDGAPCADNTRLSFYRKKKYHELRRKR